MTVGAQESTGTAAKQVVGRPFPKGISGNPGGRPKGLVRRIREETRDGEEIVDYMLRVFRDESGGDKVRMEAATWLVDRGFGKPVQPQAVANIDVEAVDLDDLTLEGLKRRVLRVLERAERDGNHQPGDDGDRDDLDDHAPAGSLAELLGTETPPSSR